MIENSFPAHGGLSQITKRCPETLRWIVRRAMAEYDRRYPSAAAMLADLRVVMDSSDPFALKPIDLPSVAQGDAAAEDMVETIPAPEWDDSVQPDFARRAGSPVPPRPQPNAAPGARVGRPQTATDFWSGKYRVAGTPVATPKRKKRVSRPKKGVVVAAGVGQDGPFMNVNDAPVGRRALRDPNDRLPAREQVKSARARAEQRRANAAKRIQSARARRGHRKSEYNNTPGAAVVFGGLLGIAVLFGIGTVGYAVIKSELENEKVSAYAHADSNGSVSISHSGDGQVSVTHKHYDESYEHPETEQGDMWHNGNEIHPVDVELLLVPMLPQPIEPDLMKELVNGTRAMEDAGVSFIGTILPGVEDEYSIDLIAQLQNYIGTTPIDSHDFHEMVQNWLLAMPFDGVLVLYNPPVDSGHKGERAFLITDQFFSDHALGYETVPVLMHELAHNGYEHE